MFLEIPETVLTRNVLMIQGDYNKGSNCDSKGMGAIVKTPLENLVNKEK